MNNCNYINSRECDLGSVNSIRSFVSSLQAKEDKVDVLVNNAGVLRKETLANMTSQEKDQTESSYEKPKML